MKVVHLCSSDFWEQGSLAYRIHKGIEKNGLESTFITMLKSSGDPSVRAIIQDPVFKDKIKLRERISINMPIPFAEILEEWKDRLGIRIMPCEGEVIFSLIDSPINLGQLEEIEMADIIHIHWIPGMLDFELAPLFFLGKPVIISLYDMFFLTGGCHYNRGCTGYLTGCMECPLVSEEARYLVKDSFSKKKAVYNLLNLKVVAKSRGLKEKAENLGLFKDVSLIHPCTPYHSYPVLNKKKAREILGLDPESTIILSIAPSLISERKGILNILEAMGPLIAQGQINKPYILLIGADGNEIEKDIMSPIHIVPVVPNEEVLSWYYCACDVFVSGGIYDPISIFALDAMAMGMPLVGFKGSCLEDFIHHKENGYIAKQGDMNDLGKGVKYVLSSIKKGKSMQKISRSIAKREFSWEGQSKKYIDVYNDMIKLKDKVNIHGLLEWGENLFSGNNKHVALELFKRLLKFDKKNPYLLNNIGVVYWEDRRYKKAMEFFKRAYEIDPDNNEIRENYLKAIHELEGN